MTPRSLGGEDRVLDYMLWTLLDQIVYSLNGKLKTGFLG